MRNLLLTIGLLLALVAVVTGCRGGVRYDARLTAADSLMAVAPDSALALVEALDSAALATPGDRAYRDLLVTQARYKCYITATTDSDINRALAYYRPHSDEQEKLTRAYIYKGAVMEELGHPDSAMLYYKHAEATAAPDDYFNLGYINLRIGKLYQSFYQNDSAVISRMESAAHYFTQANDTDFLITSLGTYGVYKYNEDIDSAMKYLEKAISLAKQTHSAKRFMFQSKLAGFYFYREEYIRSKDLSMDIIRNGKDECSENQFYYYAARSFIKMSSLDSAHYVQSLIPEPQTPLDSMNHYTLSAEMANAEHRFDDYAAYLAKAKNINDNILVNSLNSNITKIEAQCDAERSNTEYREHIKNHALIRSIIVIFAMLLMAVFFTRVVLKKRINKYQRDIEVSRLELEENINQLQKTIAEHEIAITKQGELLDAQERDIKKIHQEKDKLYTQQIAIKEEVASIVRRRLSALNELYQDIRVRSTSKHSAHNKHSLPLLSLIKEMNDKKQLSIITPKESFWRKLKSSIDDEYQGIATFLQNRYPALTIKDHHLFWLLCARISPQIIKLCMNYSNAVTVSNYKRKLIKEKMGLDISFDEFIQSYLDGRFK